MPPTTYEDAELFVKRTISSLTSIDNRHVKADANLFDLGIDSSHVVIMLNAINDYLKKLGIPPAATSRAVYGSPSVRALAATVQSLSQYRDPTLGQGNDDTLKMQRLYELHTKNLPSPSKESRPTPREQIVLLTGSTSILGSYILDALRHDVPQLSRIICLNDGPNSKQLQQRSLAANGLAKLSGDAWFWGLLGQGQTGPSVSCLDADLSQPDFGLSEADFESLLSSVTMIFHGAWTVNFNLPLDAFAPQIASVRHVADFSARSIFGTRLIFLSDGSAVAGHHDFVREQIYSGWDMPLHTGYSQSKFASERILDTLYREAGIPVTICRVGPTAGPSIDKGKWSPSDWFPSLVISSAHLHKIPNDLGKLDTIDWTPIDHLARVIVELSTRPPKVHRDETLVYHATNPRVHDWRIQRNHVLAAFGIAGSKPETVPLQDWLRSLRESASDPDVVHNPALKLLDFFEEVAGSKDGVPYLTIERTVGLSIHMFNLEATSRTDMLRWIKQWNL